MEQASCLVKNILYIGNRLEKSGKTPTSADVLPGKLRKEGFSIKVVSSNPNKFLRLLEMIFAIFRLKNWVDFIIIDTYSTSNFWYAVTCGKIAHFLRIPVIFLLHGGNLPTRFSQSSPAVLKIFRKAHRLVAPSEYLFKNFQDFNFQNLKMIPNSLELENYHFSSRFSEIPNILWLRAFDETYNPEMALEVFKIVQKKYPDVTMKMLGPDKDGSLQRIQAIVQKENLSIELPGKMSLKNWLQVTRECNVFLNTSRIDNMPVSVLEAMALGLPVISTNVGGLPYLIENGENGLLVNSGDAEKMARQVIKIFQDENQYSTLAQNGRHTAEHYSWQKVKGFWLELLG